MAESTDKEIKEHHGFIKNFLKSMVKYLIVLISNNIFLYVLW